MPEGVSFRAPPVILMAISKRRSGVVRQKKTILFQTVEVVASVPSVSASGSTGSLFHDPSHQQLRP